MLISIIVPLRNASKFIDRLIHSILNQTILDNKDHQVEVCCYNDASEDDSLVKLVGYEKTLNDAGINLVRTSGTGSPIGCGAAKNEAVSLSSGKLLCFQDADDEMHPDRILLQLEAWLQSSCTALLLIGSRFERFPVDSTVRYTFWANNLTSFQLQTQIFTAFGPTVIMPTWFMSRHVFDTVGKFSEIKSGFPEDYEFFLKFKLKHLGTVLRCPQTLLVYHFHSDATTFSVSDEAIFHLRLKYFEQYILSHLESFSIWNAGKDGRRFFRNLRHENQVKVESFCDVDAKKIAKRVYIYEESSSKPKPQIPITHFSEMKPPIVVCMKLGLTNGAFEKNLDSLGLTEGCDYFHLG